MLSAGALAVVKETASVIREHGADITSLFYKTMLTEHPELKNVFNFGNQRSGEQQQALANALYAYALNIENSAALEPVLNRIANKHASLGVTSSQYTIVGKYLLGAIANVLDLDPRGDVLIAWDEAYWVLAGELIAREAQLYYQSKLNNAEGWMTMKVSRIELDAEDIASFYLELESGEPLPPFKAGQYISVVKTLDDLNIQQIRQYSLSDAVGKPHWRITVKKERYDTKLESGFGAVSNALHHARVGDILQVSAAYGDFVLDEQAQTPIVLISAGVGVTPVMSMLNTIKTVCPQRTTRFVYAAKNAGYHALRKEVNTASQAIENFKSFIFYSDDKTEGSPNVMDLKSIKQDVLVPQAQYYLCGSMSFMRDQRASLLDLGIDPEAIQYEVFGPDLLQGLK